MVTKTPRIAVLLGLLAFSPAAALAAHPGDSIVSDGMRMHVGVVPSSVLSTHDGPLPEGHDIGPAPDVYHVLVALFDERTGKRITDATVKASVAPLTLDAPSKPLGAIPWGGLTTYCNFFRMKSGEVYDMKISVARPGAAKPVVFSVRHKSVN